MTATHRYSHPEGKALGRHHAEAAGQERFDPDKAKARGMSPSEISVLAENQARMDSLDMPDGTEVEYDLDMPDGLKRVEWTDRHGELRATTIDPEFFASHFAPIPGAPASPTHASVQEHDYERGDQARPPWRPRLRAVHVPADFEHDAIVSDLGIVGAQGEEAGR